MLYLHEIIDIVGTGQEAYLDTVGERARHSAGTGISGLMGTWKVIGSTHRWPAVVNLWEMEGWEHWADTLERQFLPEKKDPHLAPWWAKATQWRSGGFDRILEPAPYSPTRQLLQDRGLKAWVCVHTLLELKAGKREEYLEAVGETLRPMLERRGMTLMGAYSAPMRSNEAVVLWAAPDFRLLCRIYDRRHEDDEMRRWAEQMEPMRERFETMWLVPSVHCFFHPGAEKDSSVKGAERRPRRGAAPSNRRAPRADTGNVGPRRRRGRRARAGSTASRQ